jgi:hypothetical protein
MVWYDTTDLRTRPDLSKAASEAHERIQISNAAYLREVGLSADDAPSSQERKERILLKVAEGAPTLAPAMLAAAGIIDQAAADAAEASVEGEGVQTEGEPAPAPAERSAPERQSEPDDGEAPSEQAAAVAALTAACDGLVYRALERSGQRLRAAAGKGVPGGAESIPMPDPTTLHCAINATEHASLSQLLAGAWDRLPMIAARYNVDVTSLRECLDSYTCALIASGHAHDYERLTGVLGVDRAGHLVAAH